MLTMQRQRTQVRFDEAKATQVAARLLEKSGGHMSHLALVKLLYIVDREALARWGRPVSGGKYYSMPHGTVISPVVDLMRSIEGWDEPTFWTQHLTKMDNEMRLKEPAGEDELSDAEIELVDEIFERFGRLSKWQLRDLTHEFGEWIDPHGSSIPIGIDEVLHHVGKTAEQIVEIIDDLNELQKVNALIRGSRRTTMRECQLQSETPSR
jgi:uncharacterized phage-associated protein